MFETLLNFVAGVIFGTIFVLMILFFMMCMLWCRPIPRVPIAKNQPPNKIESEVEETSKWISILSDNKYFHDWFQIKLASTIQSEIEKHQNSDETKLTNGNSTNLNFKVNKVLCSSPSFETVKTIDTNEGTAISTFPITFSSDIKIETEILININDNTNKKIVSIATITSSNPVLKITIPYEKGDILIEILFGSNAQISFENSSITENLNEADGRVQEKSANLSDKEEMQIEAIQKSISQFLSYASLKIDVDTIPIEEQTKDATTETETKTETKEEGVGDPTNTQRQDQQSPKITETTETSLSISNSNNEIETKDESEDKKEDEDDNDDVEDDDEDSEEEIGRIAPIKRKFVVDQEIQQIVEQATSLINVETTTTTTTTSPKKSSDKKPQ